MTRVLYTRAAMFLLGLAAGPTPAASPEAPATGVREIILVFKTHFDIGYTDLARNIVRKYRTTMIDKALDVVDRSRKLPREQQFVWTIPGWPMSKILQDWPGQTAERRGRILQAFHEGRFVVHALPFTTHTELLEPEDLVRGLEYASRVSREAGLPLPRDAKMTDVPSHSWILPTLLKHAGVDFLHLGCNAASSSPDLPILFRWEGPDGSRLLTFYSSGGYGTSLIPPEGWPYRTWLALIHTGDNQGPPAPEDVSRLLAEAKQKLPGVRVRIGRLSDFADAIEKEHADIPVVRGDMPDTWIHGPLCDPAGAKLARSARPDCEVAESLITHLRIWGLSFPDPRGGLTEAREQGLLYGEHTWGGALAWATPYGKGLNWSYGDAWKAERGAGRFNRLEESWAEHTRYIETAAGIVQPMLDALMTALARSVRTAGPRIVVFNPLPWQRDGVVRLKFTGPAPAALRPADGGPAVPVSKEGDAIVFLAPVIPATGYRTFSFASAADVPSTPGASLRDNVLENEWFRVTLNPARGGIRSLVDRRDGRELVDQRSAYALGQYLYERFDSDQVAAYVRAYVKTSAEWAAAELGKPKMSSAMQVPYRAASPRRFEIHLEHSAVAETVTFESKPGGGIPHGLIVKVRLFRQAPYLDLEVTVKNKPADDWPEAGWVCLPAKIDGGAPRFRIGRLGAVVDPARDFVRGSNHNLGAVNTGVAMVDAGGRGLAFCPLDSPLVSLDSPGIFKYDPTFIPRRPLAFVNLFNNQWTTNFRLWNEGTWTSRVRIWPVRDGDLDQSLITPALEARYPLIAAAAQGEGQAGRLPVAERGLEATRAGVLPCAFGPNPDGPGTILRLWEYAGESGPCQIHLPAAFQVKSVQPVDLRGRANGLKMHMDAHAITINFRAFAPVSLVIDPGS
ncbi:MAG: hypothetical protein ACP5XB_02850 [Isosphaeraceae bacterium]